MKRIGRWLAGQVGDKWPEGLALLLIAVILTGMAWQKEGYHMDELLSFELSNAEYNPWIVPTQPVGRLAKLEAEEIEPEEGETTLGNVAGLVWDLWENRGKSLIATYKADVYEEPVWISWRSFQDYLTVDEKDAFQYLSVYFNVKDDNHPPLHFMALHTVSSLLKGQIFPFMGCVINIGSILSVCALIMHLGRFLDRRGICGAGPWGENWGYGRLLGMGAALWYGASSGAIATALLIRMYGMLTLWCVLLFVICVKKWTEGGFGGRNKGLIAVTVLGFWTQYFFLFYCLILAALLSRMLWRDKRLAELKKYICSMALAAVIGIAGFPFAVGDVLFSARGVEAVSHLAEGTAGYASRLGAFSLLLLKSMLPVGQMKTGGEILLAFLACGLLAAAASAVAIRRDYVRLMLVPVLGYFLLAARMSPYEVDRYIMPLFPFLYMILFFGWGCCVAERKRKGAILAAAAVGLVFGALNTAGYDGEYMYRGYCEQEETARSYQELPVICIYDGVGYYENLIEFLYYEKTLLLTEKELEERKDKASVQELEQAVILIKEEAEPEHVQQILESSYGLHPVKKLVENSVYKDEVWLYSKE